MTIGTNNLAFCDLCLNFTPRFFAPTSDAKFFIFQVIKIHNPRRITNATIGTRNAFHLIKKGDLIANLAFGLCKIVFSVTGIMRSNFSVHALRTDTGLLTFSLTSPMEGRRGLLDTTFTASPHEIISATRIRNFTLNRMPESTLLLSALSDYLPTVIANKASRELLRTRRRTLRRGRGQSFHIRGILL